MESIENVICSIDSFHVKHRGDEFSVHKVLFNLYALEEWHYARQKSDNALTSNKLWHPRAFKRYVRRERHVRKVLFR